MKFMISILLIMQLILQAQNNDVKHSVFDFDLKANHFIREQFYSLSAVYPVYHNFIIEAEYGYLYYHRAGFNIGYRFDFGNYTPYLVTGMFIQRENFSHNTHYTESSLKFGGGMEMELSHNFFFNFETTLLNYLSVNYSMRKIKFRENYDFGDSFDYSVSAAIGYRFHF